MVKQKNRHRKSELSFSKELNTWVQTVGILIAAVWGVYTFIFKEIWIPESAPVNVTVDLQLNKLGVSNSTDKSGSKQLMAVQMKLSAANPSSREVYLLPSVWVVYGYKIEPITERPSFVDLVNASLSYSQVNRERYVERHSFRPPTKVVAVGSLFSDESLRPHETVTRIFIFHVPPKEYDMLDAVATVSSARKRNQASLEWKLENDLLIPYRIDADGKRTRMQQTEEGFWQDPILKLESYVSRSQLSLWR